MTTKLKVRIAGVMSSAGLAAAVLLSGALPPLAPAAAVKPCAVSVPRTSCPPGYGWKDSLTFDPAATPGVPSPNMGMNIVSHDGKLFLGTSTGSEVRGHSGRSSYVFRKDSATSPWKLDTTFEPTTERVGAMESVRFVKGANGSPIPGGPVSMLVAGTNRNPSGAPKPVKARIRDDRTGRWTSVPVSSAALNVSEIRELATHRDRITGADMVFLAASPGPLGIYSGTYDPWAPGRIRWNSTPEIAAASDRASEKWFGMAEANGVLYASNNEGVFERIDGQSPKWEMVSDGASADALTPGRKNPEFRGLTAVPNPKKLTHWPEAQMLIFSHHNAMWRMRAGGDHPIQLEYDIEAALERDQGKPVSLAEAAFNRLNPILQPNGSKKWLIGFDFPDSTGQAADPRALFLERDATGHYGTDQILPAGDPGRDLILARDVVGSPFPSEPTAVYATGYNASVSKDKTFDGRAWVARGFPFRPAGGKACSYLLGGSGVANHLRGTSGSEKVRGRGGADHIEGLGGNDCLFGDDGSDRVVGGGGRDKLHGGAGNDRIEARDGTRDRIFCGRGKDVAIADRVDKVSRGCETVRRSGG